MDLDIVNKILSTSKFFYLYIRILCIYYSTYLLHVAILKNVKFHNIMR